MRFTDHAFVCYLFYPAFNPVADHSAVERHIGAHALRLRNRRQQVHHAPPRCFSPPTLLLPATLLLPRHAASRIQLTQHIHPRLDLPLLQPRVDLFTGYVSRVQHRHCFVVANLSQSREIVAKIIAIKNLLGLRPSY
jgi:hypothetical protein